jgi:putative aldouronate transport system substrate-binding protein
MGAHHRFDLAAPMTEFELHLITTWDQPSDDMRPVPVSLTAEEAAVFNPIMADVEALLTEYLWRFITGDEPLANYDNFRAQMTAMGIEEATDIYNAALQRYFARTLD